METVEPFTEILTIKKIHFLTGLKGNLNTFLEFYPKKKGTFCKYDMDSIVLKGTFWESIFNVGDRIKLPFKENLVPDIENYKLLKKGSKKPELPTNCLTCGTYLSVNRLSEDKELPPVPTLSCPNHYCPATSRGSIYKLLNHLDNKFSLELKKRFLDGFIYSDTVSSVDNFFEFFTVFSQVKEKNTKARLDQWEKHHGKNGELFWNLEKELSNFLSKDTLTTDIFWDCINFQDNGELDKIYRLTPDDVLNGYYKKEVSKNNLKLIQANLDHIITLKKFFTEQGVESWVLISP